MKTQDIRYVMNKAQSEQRVCRRTFTNCLTSFYLIMNYINQSGTENEGSGQIFNLKTYCIRLIYLMNPWPFGSSCAGLCWTLFVLLISSFRAVLIAEGGAA